MVYPLSNVLVDPLPYESRRKLLIEVIAWATLWTFFSILRRRVFQNFVLMQIGRKLRKRAVGRLFFFFFSLNPNIGEAWITVARNTRRAFG